MSWSSKRQSCVAKSTCEAEYMAASHAAGHLVWVRQALSELIPGFDIQYRLHMDNEPALCIVKDHRLTQRTKHINVHYHFVRERYLEGEYEVCHVSSTENLADICTKALPKPTLQRMIKRIQGLRD